MKITHPWVIIHQENGTGPMLTILSGPQDSTYEQFALCAADLIRHIARSSGESEYVVTDRVLRELGNPTTGIKRVTDG